ncbi:hypothetical protein BDZ45DRAFT_339028 [Acephala macrosclerotiorum]|nr:hypothetical protein BDZ45DRAFT_339028 [Acephala macrosclerotiorum]
MNDADAQWIFAPAHSMLESFCEILHPRQVPQMKRGYFGVYNPRANRSTMDATEQNREDLIVLIEILPEFCFLAKYKVPMLAKDELTHGLCRMALTKELPVWLVFAVTIFLDIHHILRETVDSAFQELNSTAFRFEKTLDRYFQLSAGLAKPKTWPKKNEQALREMRETLDECVFKDAIFPLKESQCRSMNYPAPPETERFYLYKRHPVLCGILTFSILLEQRELGLALAQCMGTVIYPAHLYNALRVKKNPAAPWPMMDEAIATHGENHIFFGAKPTTILDCFKQTCLTLGHSPASFAINQRRIETKISKKGPRGLNEVSPISELFYKGIRDNQEQEQGAMDMAMHKIEALLNEQALSKDLAGNSKSKRLRREWASTKKLDALMTPIPQELPQLKFDYFEMHRQSVGLLRKMHKEMDEDYTNFFGPTYLENESQLPFLGPWTLMAAVGTLKVAEAQGLSDVGSMLLEKAGKILDDYIANEVDKIPPVN